MDFETKCTPRQQYNVGWYYSKLQISKMNYQYQWNCKKTMQKNILKIKYYCNHNGRQ